MCTAVKETNIESILVVMNTTEPVVEIRPEKKIQARTGFEPIISAILVQRSGHYVGSNCIYYHAPTEDGC